SMAKGLIKDGKNVFTAMKDDWHNPNNFEHDRDVVQNTVAPLVENTALYTAGGIAGAAATRVVPVVMNESKLMNQLGEYHPETAEHSMRVAQYSQLTAKELGYPADVQNEAFHAGKMHDVGKLNTPEEVLNKKKGFDDADRAIMQAHPTASEEMLDNVGY